jgi:hypothetical protein
MFLAQRDIDTHVTAITAPPPANQPLPTDFGSKDWGFSIGICALVGMKVWELIKKAQADDSDLNRELVRALLDERKILLQYALERKT